MPKFPPCRLVKAVKTSAVFALQAVFYGLCGAATFVLSGGPSGTMVAALPLWMLRAWGVYLLMGGVFMLAGLLTSDEPEKVQRALVREMAGHVLLGAHP